MRVSYSRRTLAQLEDIFAYIAKDNPAAAAALARRIETLALLLGQHPAIGLTDKEGVRVMSIRPYPYVLFYKVLADRDEVRILRIRHTARRS
ncbi:MAG TPA: type II toxin-antitoxin system RelE/ParE family toxin [Rhodoplanes sp.]|nr:type II toxin-antitoxin system RelE/ParE family toxin [Rhodoplanes sp.]